MNNDRGGRGRGRDTEVGGDGGRAQSVVVSSGGMYREREREMR